MNDPLKPKAPAPVTWRPALTGQVCEESLCPAAATHVLVYAHRYQEVLCAPCAQGIARTYTLGEVPTYTMEAS